MKKSLILLTLLLAGCSHIDTPKSEALRLPDGSMGMTISCGGRDGSMGECMRVAGTACPGGYIVVDQSTQTTPIHYEGVGSTVNVSRNMIVKCK